MEPELCYILDAILFLYGIILTVLYCRLKVSARIWSVATCQAPFLGEDPQGGDSSAPRLPHLCRGFFLLLLFFFCFCFCFWATPLPPCSSWFIERHGREPSRR